jgi:leucyl/phenylalanyl-tRNA--protein transferase
MPLLLSAQQPFPADIATLKDDHDDYPGLVAAGGDLSVPRLITAYENGLYPWFSEGQPILWWSPDPRMVLKVAHFKLRRSLKKRIAALLREPGLQLRVDGAFAEVVRRCAVALREGQSGTWITQSIQDAYTALHQAGYAHSFELWLDGELQAGLYGVNLGRMFYGESMFTQVSDGSKACLFALVNACRARGIEWIDCQQDTAHLASLGAAPVPKPEFVQHLRRVTAMQAPEDWAYDESHLAKDLKAFNVAT